MKQNTYQITVEQLSNKQGEAVNTPAPTFQARNHDDLFAIVERIKSRGLLDSDDSAAFAIGLKLFGELILEHRDQVFFQELSPHMGAIMQVIKGAKPS